MVEVQTNAKRCALYLEKSMALEALSPTEGDGRSEPVATRVDVFSEPDLPVERSCFRSPREIVATAPARRSRGVLVDDASGTSPVKLPPSTPPDSPPVAIFTGVDTDPQSRRRLAAGIAPRPQLESQSRQPAPAHDVSPCALRIYKESIRASRLVVPSGGRIAGQQSVTRVPLPADPPPDAGETALPSSATGAADTDVALDRRDDDHANATRPRACEEPFSAGLGDAIDAEIEHTLVKLFDAPMLPGETLRSHYERKERALLAAFAMRTSLEAQQLHRRLSTPNPDDALSARFERLVVDRRTRVLTFLVDAPRREARACITIRAPRQRTSPSKAD
jgi:hypothetical protein